MRRKAILTIAIMCLFLGVSTLGGFSAPDDTSAKGAPAVGPPTATSGPVRVSGISIRPGANGKAVVEVSMTRQASFHVQQLRNPQRLVVDIEDAHNVIRQRVHPAQSAVLKGVRVAQFRSDPPEVRVVADLQADPLFDVYAVPGGVRIELRPRAAGNPPIARALPAEPVIPSQGGGAPAQTEALAALPPSASDQAQVPAPAQGAASLPSGTSTVPPPPASLNYQNALPAAAGSNQVAAAPRPEQVAQLPEVVRAANAARTVAGSPETPSGAPQGEAAQGTQEPAPAAAPPPLPPPPEKLSKYTGEPISLNLKEVDLKDFFRLTHEISGLNIIVDPNVTGNVTLVLDAVPWDQALEIVLKNNGLGKTLEGNVLRIARVDTLTAEQEAARKLADASMEAAALVTVFRPVNYAKATAVAALLTKWTGGGALTKRGNILVDERTNTLIISDIQTQVPIIESIIAKLDKKSKQVQIEARIIRANADFTRTLSSALAGLYQNRSGSTLMSGVTGTGSTGFTGPDTPHPSPIATTTSVTGFGVYAISNASARYVINAAIAAAETKSQVKTISRPTIVTQNNVPGSVQQGTQIPIQTTINNTISIQYVNATLQLQVTPQVTEDGNIFLQIQVKNASPGPALSFAGPSINTQEASTQVMVPDGGTVVFGGVTVTTRSKSATYVPVLGSIPILGRLFKSTTVQDADQELLFFVTPKVLPG